MKSIISVLLLLVSIVTSAQVKTGIETLRDSGFEALQGKRIGLITNPTGVDADLNATPDILARPTACGSWRCSLPSMAYAAMFRQAHAWPRPPTPPPA